MSRFFIALLLAGTAFTSMASAQTPTVSGLELRVTGISNSGTATIEISNASEKTLRIWSDADSWGAGHWRLLLVRNGHIETFFENPFQIFVMNTPVFKEIAPGEHLTKVLDLNGGNWCGFGVCSSWSQKGFSGRTATFQEGDSVTVIYDVPPTLDAKQSGVWWGAASAVSSLQ